MEAIIFTGIQATGKSSFYKQNFFNSHVRISLDLLNTRNKEACFLDTCFQTHAKFVIDNTNPTTKERQKYIELAKSNKYKIIGYYFNSSFESALERNNSRQGKERIPEKGVKSCFYKLKEPSMSEGFDELYTVEMVEGGFEVKKIEI